MARRSVLRPRVVILVPRGVRVAHVVNFDAWPFGAVRPNPPPAIELEIPRWMPLRRGGVFSGDVRALLRAQSGVYMVRESRNPSTILYVGMSRGGTNDDARMWKTLVRHFYRWRPDLHGRSEEWTHERPGDLDVALYLVPADDAYDVEGEAIATFEPIHAKQRRRYAYDELEASSPF